jgi:HAD superfamily hydrolase (TIGR01662 family)
MNETHQSLIDTVFFDLGNTLMFFSGDWPVVYARMYRALANDLFQQGIQIPVDEFTKHYSQRLGAYFQQRETEMIEHTSVFVLRAVLKEFGYLDISSSVARHALDAMYAVSEEYWLPEEDALPTLQTLRQQGYRLGIISNAGDDRDVQNLIDKAQIRPFFEVILSSAAFGMRKPQANIFLEGLRSMGSQPEKAVMVGDLLGADVLGAMNSGMKSVWITRRSQTTDNLSLIDIVQPDATIKALSELPEQLLRLQ